jgi:hypothetical protein
MQRAEKLLEDAQIKFSAVLSDVHGVSGRQMMEVLVAGRRDPRTLAQLARGRAKLKTAELEEALRGFSTEHRAVMLRMMLQHRPHERPDRRPGRPDRGGGRPFLHPGGTTG